MRKPFLILTILLSSLTIYAQEFSYGLTIGSMYYSVEIEGNTPLSKGSPSRIPINSGAYINHQFSDSYGVKTSLLVSPVVEKYGIDREAYSDTNELVVKKIALNLTPLFKFDTNSEYNKGFYLLAGPRLSVVVITKNEKGKAIKDFYNPVYFGAQFGFGVDFLKHFSFEFIGDYGLSDYLKSNINSNTAGAYFNLNINVESLIKK